MRRVTFNLDVPISNFASFRLGPQRTLTEAGLGGPKSFDMLIEHLKRLGFRYKVEDRADPVFIDGDPTLEIKNADA